ncbi:transcriptional regulator [Psychrobacillus sp. AK 1817]|uniref:LCP family protein n=1 Tax=Psychrobacillus sp. AK 1817 TaxID=2303505 RepID=UPI0012457F5A|nr:LCP family protein [Psychrobacillus sp. AK 1817]QEY20521.1 transcriptional regulator [Psychrobacillus sp. AK 1817]QGM31054.1 transcriptional regulator [Bacillus sp. N3536]
MTTSRQKNRKTKTRRKILYTILIVAMVLLSGVIVFATNLSFQTKNAVNKIYEPLEREEKTENEAIDKYDKAKAEDSAFTILLAGIENQEKAKYGRSDVLIVATVNPKTNKVSMVSIPRDTRVYIPDLGYNDKINHSYANGGINYTINTIEELLDIPIDYYVSTDFQGFEDIVDTVGGIEVDVPFTFKAQLTGSLKWKTYTQGTMDLNGNEALAYVRMRKSDPEGDLGRNKRQKQIIQEIIDKGTSLSNITKIDNMIEDIGNNVKTNIPSSEYFGLIKTYQKLKSTPFEQLQLKGYDDTRNGVYYFIPDEEALDEISEQLKLNLDDFGQNAKTELNQSTKITDLTIGE